MNIKEIALFAWPPFLATDIGGILGGYLCPFFMKYFKMEPPKDRQMTLLLPLPEQRKVTVKSGKIISDRVIQANREVVAEL
jgi:hypothetical protein